MSTVTKPRIVRGTLAATPVNPKAAAEAIANAVKAKAPAQPVVAQAKVKEEAVKNVYMFRSNGMVWYTHAEPGNKGPAVCRPDRRGKPSYGWATWTAPIVPEDAIPVAEIPETAAKKLYQVERMIQAADASMVHLIGSH